MEPNARHIDRQQIRISPQALWPACNRLARDLALHLRVVVFHFIRAETLLTHMHRRHRHAVAAFLALESQDVAHVDTKKETSSIRRGREEGDCFFLSFPHSVMLYRGRELAPVLHFRGCCGFIGPVPSTTLDKIDLRLSDRGMVEVLWIVSSIVKIASFARWQKWAAVRYLRHGTGTNRVWGIDGGRGSYPACRRLSHRTIGAGSV